MQRIPMGTSSEVEPEKRSFMQEVQGDAPPQYPNTSYKDVHEAPSGDVAAAELPTQRLDPVELDSRSLGR